MRSGNFELNVMMPVIAFDLLESIELLAVSTKNFEKKCLAGLGTDRERASASLSSPLPWAQRLFRKSAMLELLRWLTRPTKPVERSEKSHREKVGYPQIV